MSDDHPAMIAAHASWAAVQAGDKTAWLAIMSDDVLIEDPIGVGPTNPSGEGVRGKEAVGAFYDKNMASSTIRIEVEQSWAAGSESAHLMSLVTTLPNGVVSRVRSVFTYRVNDAGELTNLRGYWTMADMTFTQPDA